MSTASTREPNGLWKKGSSGNPAGRAPPTITLHEVVLLAREHSIPAMQTLIDIMMTSERETVRMRAAELILDRAYGRTVQAVEARIDQPSTPERRAELAVLFDRLAVAVRAGQPARELEPG